MQKLVQIPRHVGGHAKDSWAFFRGTADFPCLGTHSFVHVTNQATNNVI